MIFFAAGELDRLWVITEPLSAILAFTFVAIWLINTIYLYKNILWTRN
jgi:hypothetical protein